LVDVSGSVSAESGSGHPFALSAEPRHPPVSPADALSAEPGQRHPPVSLHDSKVLVNSNLLYASCRLQFVDLLLAPTYKQVMHSAESPNLIDPPAAASTEPPSPLTALSPPQPAAMNETAPPEVSVS
jgi:hypothetical protein